jgi:small subunit ribosomal protein S17
MRNKRKVRTGIVKSAKMDKTIVVAVERTLQHTAYGKTINKTSKLYAHEAENQAALGDQVVVMETRPLSKTKRWRLMKILQKSE